MKLVFALYKYFPYGGLQKDMLSIARECVSRGHHVSIFCRSWEGDLPFQQGERDGISVNLLPGRAITNQGKDALFRRQFKKAMRRVQPDLVVGFNKIPGVDVYYAADSCFKAKLFRERPWLYRWLPRYRQHVREEAELFDHGTHILAIAKSIIDEYREFYQTDMQYFTLLPPGISRDRVNATGERLYLLHKELELTEDKLIVLMVGSGFRTKGLDRAIKAIAALPADIKNDTHLVIAGQDHRKAFVQQAAQLGIEEQVHFLGGRKDVPQLLRSADVLIHPAYREAAGMVLLEAVVACLPVITTDVCGYAHYIADNNLGMVLPSPFHQTQLNDALLLALTDVEKIKHWRNNSRVFAQEADIYGMSQKAADAIEAVARQRGRS